MINRFLRILICFVFLFSFKSAFAEISINEIMYDLDGGDIDWVEVINEGDDVDLSSLKLYTYTSTSESSNHGIVNVSGSNILHSGDYAIIVVTSSLSYYQSRWGITGNIFTSSFSLPNTTSTIEINAGDKNSPISSVLYDSSQGASGDGKSLQKIEDYWISGTPTPNSTNSSNTDNTENTEEADDVTVSKNSSSSKTNIIPKEPKAKIITSDSGFVGIPISFFSNVTGTRGEILNVGKFYYNFGDGSSAEYRNNEIFNHIYFYEGEYVVYFDFYEKYTDIVPMASSKITIKIIPLTVSISKIGDPGKFFVEITNNSQIDIDISGWHLSSNRKVFTFPKNTIIGAKKKMILAGHIINFDYSDKDNISLFNSQDEIVFKYGSNNISSISFLNNYNREVVFNKTETSKNLEDQISYNDIQIKENSFSDISDNKKDNSNNLIIIILFVFICILSSVSIFFLRKNRVKESEEIDFDLLDE